MSAPQFRAGDTVRHAPSGETWVLACDELHGEVMPAGWPESYADARDCTLGKAASDEERLQMLRDAGKPKSFPDGYSRRRSLAAHQLKEAEGELPQPVKP